MAQNIMKASREWRTRPHHEAYYDVKDVIPVLERAEKFERSMLVPMDEIKVIAQDDDLYLGLPKLPAPARLNNWSLDRLATHIDASVSDLRKYPADLVAPLLQYRLSQSTGTAISQDDDESMDDEMTALYGDLAEKKVDTQSRQLDVLLAPNHAGLYVKSIDSSSYGRYRNLSLAKDALMACEYGWRTPRCMAKGNNPFNDVTRYGEHHIQADRLATADDEMKCSLIKAGMKIGPGGVYVGDRNMFVFLVSDMEVLPGHYRFVILENSEVGEARTLQATFGLFNYVCYNHILWNCTNVHSVKKKHRRGSVGLFHQEFAESLDLVTRSEGIPESLYNLAKTRTLGTTDDDVVKNVYGRRIPGLTQGAIRRAIECARTNPNDADGAPLNSYWSFVQGLTRYSQSIPYADRRTDLDRAAGSILDDLKLEDKSPVVSPGMDIDDSGVVATVETSKPRGRKAKTN